MVIILLCITTGATVERDAGEILLQTRILLFDGLTALKLQHLSTFRF